MTSEGGKITPLTWWWKESSVDLSRKNEVGRTLEMWGLFHLLALQLKDTWVAWLNATESLVTQLAVSYSEHKDNKKIILRGISRRQSFREYYLI